jgi:hypothetical protein
MATLAEQQQTIRDALARLATEPRAAHGATRGLPAAAAAVVARGVPAALHHALGDHDHDGACPAAPDDCVAVHTARAVLAWEGHQP